jgi:hypothetical protein
MFFLFQTEICQLSEIWNSLKYSINMLIFLCQGSHALPHYEDGGDK